MRVVVVRYKLAYRIVKTKEELKQIYPYIIEDLKTMEFKTNIGFPLGYEYRNGDEALSVFRKIYSDFMRDSSPKEKGTSSLKWILSAWLRSVYLRSGFSKSDKEYNNRILELYEYANYLEVNKDEIYKM